MAAYPRNNLNEQLSLKSKTGQANGTSNSGARTARQQAGLAREMSGVAQYVSAVVHDAQLTPVRAILMVLIVRALLCLQPKAAFTFACEGSARVQPGNKKQPISVESSSSTLSRSASSSSGPSVIPGNRAASGQGLLQNKQANNTSALKGKGRARRFEEIQDTSMLVDEYYDDSGFADVQPASKRPKGNSTIADQVRLAACNSHVMDFMCCIRTSSVSILIHRVLLLADVVCNSSVTTL